MTRDELGFISNWPLYKSFPGGSVVKNLPANAGNVGLVPGWGRSPEGGNGSPLQCSCLGNPMNRGAWWSTVYGVAKSQTWLSDWACTHNCSTCEGQGPFTWDREAGAWRRVSSCAWALGSLSQMSRVPSQSFVWTLSSFPHTLTLSKGEIFPQWVEGSFAMRRIRGQDAL